MLITAVLSNFPYIMTKDPVPAEVKQPLTGLLCCTATTGSREQEKDAMLRNLPFILDFSFAHLLFAS